MTLRAILFDLDDTLHDKSATLRRVAVAQFEQAELSKRSVDQIRWVQWYTDLNNERIEKTEVFTRLAAEFCLDTGLEQMLREDFDANLGAMACPFEGALNLIHECKSRGMKIGVVTNGRDAFQRSKITGLGLDGVIDCTVTSGGLGIKKPDHRIFLTCLDTLRVAPAEAAFVGDDFVSDMEPAAALGMLAVWKSAESSSLVSFSSNELEKIHVYLRSKTEIK